MRGTRKVLKHQGIKIQIEKREVNPEPGNNLVTDLVPGQGLDHKICAMDVSDFCSWPSSNWWNFQTNPWIQFNTNYRAQIISKSKIQEENFQVNYPTQCSLLYISLNCCMDRHVLYLLRCCWILWFVITRWQLCSSPDQPQREILWRVICNFHWRQGTEDFVICDLIFCIKCFAF